MIKVFLDTNIILDIIEERQQFLLPSLNVFDLGVRGKIQLCATSLTFANCIYVARKNVGYENAITGLRRLKQILKIVPMDDAQCLRALNSDMPDLEDMLQFEAAIAFGCDVIVTRDKNRHFPQNIIPILSPSDFLDFYQNNIVLQK